MLSVGVYCQLSVKVFGSETAVASGDAFPLKR